ncbi:MAG: hemolysin family protein, partial [Coprobacillaceae bacterium]
MDAGELNIFVQLLVLVLLTGINAFFACAEMAIVSVNKNKMKALAEEGNKKAKTILKLLEEPTKFLSTIQVAITLAGYFASAFAATSLSARLGGVLVKLNIPYSNEIAVVVITIILSYFTLVFGELVPKRIALQKANSISLFVVNPILFVSKFSAPFVKFLSFSTNLILKILGMHNEKLEEQVSEEEIKSMLQVGKETGVFDEYEQDLIESIFEFDDTLAREAMTSRKDVYCIDINEPLSTYIEELLLVRHSRIPVYRDDIDNIIGILYLKDFIVEAYKKGFDNVDI